MEQFRLKIEQFAQQFERQGISPVASRIVFYLFLHPDTEATFEEIVQYFGVSKSAVSNALKLLELMQVVSVKTKHGGRKRYFSVSLDYYFSPDTVLKSYRELKTVLEELAILRQHDEKSERISHIAEFIGMLEVAYPELYQKWVQQKAN